MTGTMSVSQMSTCNTLNWMVPSIAWTYPALFTKIIVLLKFHHDLTYLKPDLWQWYFTSNVTYNTNCSRHYHKERSKSILHSPTVTWIQITREARNSKYLLNVKNIQQKHINFTQVLSSLIDLPLVLESPSLLHQWTVTSQALKPII